MLHKERFHHELQVDETHTTINQLIILILLNNCRKKLKRCRFFGFSGDYLIEKIAIRKTAFNTHFTRGLHKFSQDSKSFKTSIPRYAFAQEVAGNVGSSGEATTHDKAQSEVPNCVQTREQNRQVHQKHRTREPKCTEHKNVRGVAPEMKLVEFLK